MRVHPIVIEPSGKVAFDGQVIEHRPALDAFAVEDGFEDWSDMRRFWALEHPNITQWTGVRICWSNFIPAADAEI